MEMLDRLDWEIRDRIDGRLGIWAVQAIKQIGLAVAIYASFWAMCLWASI